MSKSAQSLRNMAFYRAAENVAFIRQYASKNYSNSWTSIPKYRREAYLAGTSQLKNKSKISEIIDDFRELDGLYNSVVWDCLDPEMTLPDASNAIRNVLKISKPVFDIQVVIENLLSDKNVYIFTPLNHIAVLLCCLRHTYKIKDLYLELCVRLAREILMLYACHIDRCAAEYIWECCDINLVKKQKNKGLVISFNFKTRVFAEDHITNMIQSVQSSMFPSNTMKHMASLDFRRELIKYFVDELINLDPDVTRHLLVSIHRENAHSKIPFDKIDMNEIGIFRYLKNNI
jgi:hypothetical protein